ncbi:MAG: XdhC family protein [Sphingomonadales bacterium]|nr:XdhC family protein [Sphingomonadales bacterium]
MQTGSANHDRILAAAIEWAGAPMAIATVVETWKSAPCPVGTHMLVHGDGRFVGSVSGGCVEADVLERAQMVLAGAPAIVRRYGVADDAAWDVGLPCGGDIQVLVQPVSADGFPAGLFADIVNARGNGATLAVVTNLATGRSMIAQDAAAESFVNVYYPPRRLLIVGAVEIAARLDDRWPDEAVKAFAPDSRSAIVTLSHDPKIDDPALISALDSPAAYIAALGSVRSHAARLSRLSAAGVGGDQTARIEGPAGVAINAISAPEIALSIAGGMIRAFNMGLR